uniref:Myb-like domain-containing protein n=1 Tax=Stomoxys calcitrans TaxID=35570 RepID=A0A1I8P7P4_STOCA
MAMRRPRIKAQANIQLNSKRKSKTADEKAKISESHKDDTNSSLDVSTELGVQGSEKSKIQENETNFITDNGPTDENVSGGKEVISSQPQCMASDTNASDNICNSNVNASTIDLKCGVTHNDESINNPKTGNNPKRKEEKNETAFKCPPKVEQRLINNGIPNPGTDDVFYSDIEENILQMDLQKSPSDVPSSPSKNQQAARQRIKATPIFGQRRNSFVGSSPSPHSAGGDECNDFVVPTQRRERHISSSMSTNSNSSSSSQLHHTQHKYLPNGVANANTGRVRTESVCSAMSDTVANNHKVRKTDDHKQNLKRDFEARFSNGVPDKSALKMSDLIFYNPATNPMEQKPNPNMKVENCEKSSNASDMKPFKQKKEKDSENDGESVPVPQLKLNSNGELILDDKSLVIETTAEQEARKVLANSSLIYLDENTGMNGFYSRQKRTRDWPSTETIKFYRCLQTVGTDFSLMVPLFPNRTRRDLKLKFKKEERINGHLINKALLYPKTFNVEELKQQMDEEDKIRAEEAERIKQLKEAVAKGVRKRKNVRSHADGALNGANVYENEIEQKPNKARKTQPKPAEKSVAPPPPPTLTKTTAVNIESQLAVDTVDVQINPITTSCTEQKVDITISKSKIKTENNKFKRRRKRIPNIKKESTQKVEEPTQVEDPISPFSISSPTYSSPSPHPAPIKDEIIKNEPIQGPLFITKTEVSDDDEQLEEVVEDFLHSDVLEDNDNSMPLPTCTTSSQSTTSAPIAESVISTDSCALYIHEDEYCEDSMEADIHCEGRTFVNLDDGSVTTISDVNNMPQTATSDAVYEKQAAINQPTPSPSPPSLPTPSPALAPQYHYPTQTVHNSPPTIQPPDLICNDTSSSLASERELNEQDIEHILTELAEGSLVLVSTLDPDDPDKVLNEIFMVDKNTGDLCDEPLNIPDNIVQCILSVMS